MNSLILGFYYFCSSLAIHESMSVGCKADDKAMVKMTNFFSSEGSLLRRQAEAHSLMPTLVPTGIDITSGRDSCSWSGTQHSFPHLCLQCAWWPETVNLLVITLASLSRAILFGAFHPVYQKAYCNILELSFYLNLGALAAATEYVTGNNGSVAMHSCLWSVTSCCGQEKIWDESDIGCATWPSTCSLLSSYSCSGTWSCSLFNSFAWSHEGQSQIFVVVVASSTGNAAYQILLFHAFMFRVLAVSRQVRYIGSTQEFLQELLTTRIQLPVHMLCSVVFVPRPTLTMTF